ncbi:hypothetical protein KJ742_05550 [Patescibacteria group bacterium]|nr:hypothetical protein [Patescibacteria group bacterium]MBU1935467.1 hypothetical protein [Patescibacteria group bacterium]
MSSEKPELSFTVGDPWNPGQPERIAADPDTIESCRGVIVGQTRDDILLMTNRNMVGHKTIGGDFAILAEDVRRVLLLRKDRGGPVQVYLEPVDADNPIDREPEILELNPVGELEGYSRWQF